MLIVGRKVVAMSSNNASAAGGGAIYGLGSSEPWSITYRESPAATLRSPGPLGTGQYLEVWQAIRWRTETQWV
jgi:predicted outer membrane repeat protein